MHYPYSPPIKYLPALANNLTALATLASCYQQIPWTRPILSDASTQTTETPPQVGKLPQAETPSQAESPTLASPIAEMEEGDMLKENNKDNFAGMELVWEEGGRFKDSITDVDVSPAM